ncbi:UspA domain-containing protein [Gemmatirosa kalamazoonensis]|uniref:UspA domain-containing protein n=1 Tax=Gemmatirosa kalamazoonensis TaxID=861299 RepID=W0RGJ1_9BACT|nr:universal stress protein [Gemmatirosa kalamazoonensis]AHG89455.1 UspA domain-containing protein [Gemmatirosa kalamazoonensis]
MPTTLTIPELRTRPIIVASDGRDDGAPALLTAERLACQLGDGAMAWPTRIVSAPSADAIAAVADEERASLVVLDIGRHRLYERLLGTETSLRVLRGGDRPVLAVGPEADGVFRRAVVALDFGAASLRAAAIAARLLAPGGILSLVHVKPRVELWEPGVVESPSGTPGLHGRLQRLAAALRHGTTGCEECGAGEARPDVRVGTATLVGDPAAELLDYAAHVGADLVAVGTRGAGFVERLLVGSVATDVIRGTSARLPGCSVLACPAPCPTAAARLTHRLGALPSVADGHGEPEARAGA